MSVIVNKHPKEKLREIDDAIAKNLSAQADCRQLLRIFKPNGFLSRLTLWAERRLIKEQQDLIHKRGLIEYLIKRVNELRLTKNVYVK